MNNSGNWDYNTKKRKYQYQDDDQDGIDDYTERMSGIHDENNKHIRNFNVGGNLYSNKSGIIVLPHQHLKSYQAKHRQHNMKLKINEPRKMPLSLKNFKAPNLNGMNMKNVKMPKTSMEIHNFKMKSKMDTDYIDNLTDFLTGKKRKRGELF